MKKDIYYYLEDNGQSSTIKDYDKTFHRLDGPAVELTNGDKYWYQHGLLYRLDGPAIEWANGDKSWYQNGKRHREDGPASEWVDGSKFWYQNGLLHRLDGPAIKYADGHKLWYYKNIYLEYIISQKQYEQWLKLKAFW